VSYGSLPRRYDADQPVTASFALHSTVLIYIANSCGVIARNSIVQQRVSHVSVDAYTMLMYAFLHIDFHSPVHYASAS
jgi:hypothetical protein